MKNKTFPNIANEVISLECLEFYRHLEISNLPLIIRFETGDKARPMQTGKVLHSPYITLIVTLLHVYVSKRLLCRTTEPRSSAHNFLRTQALVTELRPSRPAWELFSFTGFPGRMRRDNLRYRFKVKYNMPDEFAGSQHFALIKIKTF